LHLGLPSFWVFSQKADQVSGPPVSIARVKPQL
jgi:hypothetical protein